MALNNANLLSSRILKAFTRWFKLTTRLFSVLVKFTESLKKKMVLCLIVTSLTGIHFIHNQNESWLIFTTLQGFFCWRSLCPTVYQNRITKNGNAFQFEFFGDDANCLIKAPNSNVGNLQCRWWSFWTESVSLKQYVYLMEQQRSTCYAETQTRTLLAYYHNYSLNFRQ